MSPPQVPSFDRTLYRTQYKVGPLLEQGFRYAFYALSLLDNMIDTEKREVKSDLPLLIRAELQQAANQVFEGFQNALRMPWSLEEFEEAYAECGDNEEELVRRCPPPQDLHDTPNNHATSHYTPTFFVDKNDRLLFAYVPAMLRESRWQNLLQATTPIFNQASREHSKFIRHSSHSVKARTFGLQPGVLILYPGIITSYKFPTVHYPEPAAAFKNPHIRPHVFELLDTIDPDTFGILCAVLAMIHPDRFHAAFEILEGLHNGTIWSGDKSLREEIMKRWGFPFTCVGFFSNLKHPYWERSDVLKNDLALYLSMGSTSLTSFTVPGLHRKFHFDPGTICVGFPHVFPVSWSSSEDGDQLTFVGSFMDLRFATSRLVRNPRPMGTREYTAYVDYMIRNESPPLD
ncbi:hypothetical protein CC2G_002190 [Coprinopsis cinerea AmutBmut pab1-1]|nr:hypothetical protein CC2G_002190 [Coprinopsis cinerea AmutBmut pab1-1]